MDSKSKFCLLVSLVVVALLPGGMAHSAEPSTKHELAVELIRVAGGAEMAEQISAIMSASMKQSYASMVGQVIASQPSLSPEERQAIEARLANYDRFSEKLDARLVQEVDFETILNGVYVPLYEKHFTESELRQILEFQSSAVGRKAASLLPQLMQEGMAGSMPLIQPIIMSIVGEIFQEEQAIALKEM